MLWGALARSWLPSVSRTVLCRRTWPGFSLAGTSAQLTLFSLAVTKPSAGAAWEGWEGVWGLCGRSVLEQGGKGAGTDFRGGGEEHSGQKSDWEKIPWYQSLQLPWWLRFYSRERQTEVASLSFANSYAIAQCLGLVMPCLFLMNNHPQRKKPWVLPRWDDGGYH